MQCWATQHRAEDDPSSECLATQRGTGGGRSQRQNRGSDGRGDGGKMSDAEATRFNAMVVRCNFLGSDGPDVQLAAKEA